MSTSPNWKSGLKRVGTYYEGYVCDLEPVLEDYLRDTVTSWGTRRSKTADNITTSTVEDKENKASCPNEVESITRDTIHVLSTPRDNIILN